MLAINEIQLPPPKSWETLEDLIRDLLRAEWNDFHTQRNGRRGQSQQGVDVFGRSGVTPGWAGAQCKNKDLSLRATLSIKELRQEVHNAKSFVPPLTEFIVATTAPRDSKIQEEARKLTVTNQRKGLFSVHVYAWEDVQDLMAKHDTVSKHYYRNFWPSGAAQGPMLSETTVSAVFAAPPMKLTSQTSPEVDVRVLSAPAHRALGILATCPMPYPEDVYTRIFPETDWKKLLPELVDAKAVTLADTVIGVEDAVKTRFLPTDTARGEFFDMWIAALEPLSHHVDMAIFLAMQHLAKGNHARAVEVVVDVAAALEPGFWNNQYAAVLRVFDEPKMLRCLTAQQRRDFLSAYGICLARAKEPARALPVASRLLTASQKACDRENVAQAHLLFGIAHQHLGDTERAADSYARTAAYAKSHRLDLLLGHALHNLAMLKVDSDPDEAGRILERSIAAKKSANDGPGRVGALFGRGALAASQGQFKVAFNWYTKTEALAARLDMEHARALALCNMGASLVDQDNPRAAVEHYRAAEKIASDEVFPDVQRRAVGGVANVYLELKRFAKAEEWLRRLHTIQQDANEHADAVGTLHAVGVCVLNQGKIADARQVFSSAYDNAIKEELPDWIYRCTKDIALSHLKSDGVEYTLVALREAASRQESEGRFKVCANLWESVASVLDGHTPLSPDIELAFRNAIKATERGEGQTEKSLRLHSGLFQNLWQSGRFEKALDALRTGSRVAKEARNREYMCRFVDQLGMCLQQRGALELAIREHRVSLRLARSLQISELTENCLNNLGEALRKTGKSEEAIALFHEAEGIARKRGDAESELSVAHNRALVLEDLGRRAQAASLLRRCRDKSLELECWDQFARALHGLANHAWATSKVEEAIDLYRQAFGAVKKHQLPEQSVAIAVNYANALRQTGRLAQAHKLLLSVQGNALTAPDADEYFTALGQTAEEVGETGDAVAAYESAWTVARAAGSDSGAALAAATLAESLLRSGEHGRAQKVIDEALAEAKTTSQKVPLLTARVRLLLGTGQRPQAGREFGRATRLAQAESMNADLVDLHMLLGDYDWQHGKSKTEAAKAYIAALIPANAIGVEVMFQTGAHMIAQLLSLPEVSRLQTIEKLLAALGKWLTSQMSNKQLKDEGRILLWPLRVALRATREGRNLASMSEREMKKFLHPEIE